MDVLTKIEEAESIYAGGLDIEVFFFLTGEKVIATEELLDTNYGGPVPIYYTKKRRYHYIDDIMGCIGDMQFLLAFIDPVVTLVMSREGLNWVVDLETESFTSQGKHEDPQLALIDAVCEMVQVQREDLSPPPANDNLKQQYPRLKPK